MCRGVVLRVSRLASRVDERLGGERRVDPKHLGKTDLVTGEPPSTTQAVPSDLLRIARSVDALIPNCLEEGGLQRQREDVHHAAFDRQRLHGGDDLPPETIPLCLWRDGNRRDLGHGRRILLEGAARADPPSFVDGNEKVVDGEGHLLRRAAEHQVLDREEVVEPSDLSRLALVRGANEQMLMTNSRHRTCSSTSIPTASSSRVVTSGGRSRTVHSPAVQVSSPSSRAASTTWDALPMMSIPHM